MNKKKRRKSMSQGKFDQKLHPIKQSDLDKILSTAGLKDLKEFMRCIAALGRSRKPINASKIPHIDLDGIKKRLQKEPTIVVELPNGTKTTIKGEMASDILNIQEKSLNVRHRSTRRWRRRETVLHSTFPHQRSSKGKSQTIDGGGVWPGYPLKSSKE